MKHMQDTLHQCLHPGLSGFQPSQNSNAGGVEHCSPGSLGQRHRPGSYGAISMWVSIVMVPQWLDSLEWNILMMWGYPIFISVFLAVAHRRWVKTHGVRF